MLERRPFLGQVALRQLGQPGGTGSPGGAFSGGPSGGGGFSGGFTGVIGGPSGPSVAPGGPSVSVAHQNFTSFPMNVDNFNFGFNDWWPYYYNYPAYRPQQERMLCRRLERQSEAEGRDVFECVQEAQYAAPVFGYPMPYPWYTGW